MCHSQGEKHRGSSAGKWVFLPNKFTRGCVNSLEEEVRLNERPDEIILQNLLHILLISIHRDLQQAGIHPALESGKSTHSESVSEIIEQSKRYIQSHLSDVLSLDILAHNTGMSRARYTRCFRSQTGMSVNEFIGKCRLDMAKALLAESNWSISSITLIAGLSSTSYFRRFFAGRMQMSPTEYRQRIHEQS
jgi:transcriptional regulator GlxA family with amidase domain